MGKINDYFAKHIVCNSLTHLSAGLGIAWLVSLNWHYSTIALVLGIVSLVSGVVGHVYALLARQ